MPANELTGVLPTIEPGIESDAHNSSDWTKKTEPGIADFKDRPEDVGEHLEPLLDHALEIIPESEIPHTPIYLFATAGLRLVHDDIREQILTNSCSYIKENYNFLIQDCKEHIKNITGEEEGIYGWVAINYLMGGFDNGGVKMIEPSPSNGVESDQNDVDEDSLSITPSENSSGSDGKTGADGSIAGRHTLGFLDMGGASTQIAFEPSLVASQEHANDLTPVHLQTLDGGELQYNVFVTTFLGYGSNQARRRYVKDYLLQNNKDLLEAEKPGIQMTIDDPCLPKNLKLSETHMLPHVPLLGSGSFTECLKKVEALLNKDKECHDVPCLFNGVHTPPIDFNINTFIGVSEYWYSSHDILGLGGAYDYAEFEQKSAEFCNSEWDDIKDRPEYQGQSQERLEMQCFKSAWLSNVLHSGFGLPRFGEKGAAGSIEQSKEVLEKAEESIKNKNWTPFQSINAIKDIQVTWTLGAMLLISSGSLGPTGSVDGAEHSVHQPTQQILPPPDHKAPHEESYPERMLDSYNHFTLVAIVIFALALFVVYRSKVLKSIIKRWLNSSVSSPGGSGSGGSGLPFFGRFRRSSGPSSADYSALESGTGGSVGSYGRAFSPRASLKVFYLSVVHHTRSVWWSITSRIWPEPANFDPMDTRNEEMIESITIAGYDGSSNTTAAIAMSNAVSHHGGTPAGSFGTPGLSSIPETGNTAGAYESGYHRSQSGHNPSHPPKTTPKFFRINKKRFSGDSQSLFAGRGNQAPAEGCVINTALLQKPPKNSVELTARSGSSLNLSGLWSGVSNGSHNTSSLTPNTNNNPNFFNPSGSTTPATATSATDPLQQQYQQQQQPTAWKQGWIPEEMDDVPTPSLLTTSRSYTTTGQSPLLTPMSRYKQQQLVHQDGSTSAPSSTVNLGTSSGMNYTASGFATSADEREEWSPDGGDGDDEDDGSMDRQHRQHYYHQHATTHLKQYQQQVQMNQQEYSQHPVRASSAVSFSKPSVGHTSVPMGSRYKQRSTGLLSGINFETGISSMTTLDDNESAGEAGYVSGSSSAGGGGPSRRSSGGIQIQTGSRLTTTTSTTTMISSSTVSAGAGISRSASPMMSNQQHSTSSLVLGRHNVSEQDQQLVSRGSSENTRRGSMGAAMSP
ncbi:Golgi apyrase [Mortierella polycephala]|uniref:Golgi apyrase n=1 Tax=Mortierella polycephala TaxID=41804 RepID=A0A9P6U1E9_9FUNG|nr:Golgi apyrase [Mortierella polycephala]